MKQLLVLILFIVIAIDAQCGQLDVIYVIDGSGSIVASDWKAAQVFLITLSKQIGVSPSNAHAGLVQSSSDSQGNAYARVESQLTGDLNAITTAIQNMQQIGYDTAIGEGMRVAQVDVFGQTGRQGFPHFMLVITDGQNNCGYDPIQVATILKAAPYNVAIGCVGVGSDADMSTLDSIASPPASQTVYGVDKWTNLLTWVNNITNAACNSACPNGCSGQGVCNSGTCNCNDGFYGADCSQNGSTPCPNDCSGNGQCDPNTGICTCNPGWLGVACNSSQPCPGNCNGHGRCYGGNCTCESGWDGPDCGSSMPCPSQCSGNGLCVGGQCQCNPGYDGDDCSHSKPCPNSCSNQGICQGGNCICNQGYTGDDCSQPYTPPTHDPFCCKYEVPATPYDDKRVLCVTVGDCPTVSGWNLYDNETCYACFDCGI